MKRLMLTMLVLGLAVASSGAEAAFTCEQIKDKKTRTSCMADRVEKEKTDAAEKEKVAESEKNKDLNDFVSKSKDALTKNFKDPGSAQFSGLVISNSSFSRTLCGSVNGKNSYGGYVGSKRFTVEWFASKPGVPFIWTEFQSTTEKERSSDYPPIRENALEMVALELSLYQMKCEPSATNSVTKIDSNAK